MMTAMITQSHRSDSHPRSQLTPPSAQQQQCRPTSPSSSKKKFQRLRVRSLSRTRSSTKSPKDAQDRTNPTQQNEDDRTLRAQQFASPMSTRRRNNSAGNLYAVDGGGLSGAGSLTRLSRSTLGTLLQDAQRSTMRHLSKSWDSLTRMADGRTCQILLLDGRKIEIFLQPKLLACELLDIVSSHYNLKEKEYFGLAYQDETSSFCWLQLDKRVLEHEFVAGPKKHKLLVLHFMVKFFVESVTHLRDIVTVELFYLQAKALVFKGVIQTEQETAFELVAYVLQASYGDFFDVESASVHLKKHPLLPSKVIKEACSYAYCEERIVEYYKKLKGLQRGNAIVNYMTIIESLSTYGVHYFDVTDKHNEQYLLGISFKGLGQYKHKDKRVAERAFLWKDLGNLFFRDKKFSAEVLEARRIVHALSSINLYEDAIEEPSDQCDDLSNAISDPTTQVSVSRRTFAPGQLAVHVWFAATPSLAKAIWTMAISQHQFYLDRKKSQNVSEQRTPAEIAADLTNATSLYNIPDSQRQRSGSVCSTYSYRIVRDGSLTSGFASDDSISQMSETEKKEMYHTAKTRRDVLDEKLKEKLARLRELCLQEGQITGELPPETPLNPGEVPPIVRRRMGTAFELSSSKVESDPLTAEEKELHNLELHYELQMNITKAQERLLNDAGKTIRRQRKQAYRKEYTKLKEIEKKLKDMRSSMDRDQPTLDSRDFQISHSSSISSGLGDSSSLQSFNKPPHSPAVSLRSSTSRSSMSIPDVSSAPPSRSQSNSNFRPGGSGYIPSNVYQTRTSYRHQQYPTLLPPVNSTDSSSVPCLPSERPTSGSPFAAPREPRIIHHKIVIEAPLTTAVATVVPPIRSSSWDRSKLHQVQQNTPSSSPKVTEPRYSTLDLRKSRQRPRDWPEAPPEQHHRIPTPQSVNSPSPLCYTAEVTKPYELTDYYKYSNRVRKLNRTTPEEPDSGMPISPNNVLHVTHAYPVSPNPSAVPNGFRHGIHLAGTSSPGGGSSSSSRSDLTVSPAKFQTNSSASSSSQLFATARPLQCLPAYSRSNREAQIAWNDEGIPKTPTIV